MLVFISLLVTSPISWIVMNNWLQNFAFHIDLNVIPFIIIGRAAIAIAAVAVSPDYDEINKCLNRAVRFGSCHSFGVAVGLCGYGMCQM